MEITGKVINILPIQGGESNTTGKSWQVKTFIIETQDKYTHKVAIELFGEDRIKDNPVQVDNVYNISFDLESREFNGRWYTSARAWKVVASQSAQPSGQYVAPAAPMPQAPAPSPAPAPAQYAPQAPAAPAAHAEDNQLPF